MSDEHLMGQVIAVCLSVVFFIGTAHPDNSPRLGPALSKTCSARVIHFEIKFEIVLPPMSTPWSRLLLELLIVAHLIKILYHR